MRKKAPKCSILARKYEAAWHKLFYKLDKWRQDAIIEEPHGRHADELAHEAAILAESSNDLELLNSLPNSGVNPS